MTDDTWVLYLVNLASLDTIASRPAIRSLYYMGREVDWIADAAGIPVDLVRDALTRIP